VLGTNFGRATRVLGPPKKIGWADKELYRGGLSGARRSKEERRKNYVLPGKSQIKSAQVGAFLANNYWQFEFIIKASS
jgi:hypothetical protein